MFRHPQIRLCAAAFGLLAAAVVCPAAEPAAEEMQALIADLHGKNASLERALVQANKAEKEATEQLAQVRLRLEALGKNLLDGGNERLVQAAADLEIARERNTELETASSAALAAIVDYLRQAVVSDPDSRLRLETALRELDLVLGFKQKPRADVRVGVLRKAEIVSVDQDSGMVVFNIGDNQGVKIGMTFDLFRGQLRYGQAVVVDVRKAVAGAFIDQPSLDPSVGTPHNKDIAVLRTE